MTINNFGELSLSELIDIGEFECSCGKRHGAGVKKVLIEKGAIKELPSLIKECSGKKPFILSGKQSFSASGKSVLSVVEAAGIAYTKYVYPYSPVVPEEHAVGAAVMHFDRDCDCVVAIGSGVINDIGKILAGTFKIPYIIVASAPSMDGFASATSSMEMDGLKVSLNSTFPWAVLGDTDILKSAPLPMLCAGVGDMLAKYISLAEWRIAHLIVGEYYCPLVAALVENALKKVVNAAEKLLEKDEAAIKSVMEGMVIGGVAMNYAGLSRPASGMEHYFSHIWDMRALAFDNVRSDLHGIQCGIGTLLSLKAYMYLQNVRPSWQKAAAHAASFDLESWNRELEEFIGPGAKAMVLREAKEGKYKLAGHASRFERIIDSWDEIQEIISALPDYREIYQLMVSLHMPTDPHYLGYSNEDIRKCFSMTKDIRDKYIGSRLLWDLGELEEAKQKLL